MTNRQKSFEGWKKDYEVFLTSSPEMPSSALSDRILSTVHQKLNPPRQKVLSKLILVHLVTLFASLLVCPQLGVGPFGGGHGLMALVMPMGSWVCAAFCSSFLFLSTAAVGHLCLRAEEARVVFKNRFWQLPLLTAFSFGVLMAYQPFTSPHQAHGPSLSFDYVLVWLIVGLSVTFLSYMVANRFRGLSENTATGV